jgi:hypothetical protein
LGDFLVVGFSKDSRQDARRLFQGGLEVARSIKGQVPSQIVETEWVYAASFPRLNGSGTPIVFDPEKKNWLLAIGTWFHMDGYGVGSEARLLSRYLQVGSHQLAQELEGFFVIVVGDARVKETIAFTDIVGSCHGFLRSWKHLTALSSSSLLLAGLEDFSLDPTGCQEFLRTGIVYEDRTFYREIRKLGPATILRFSEGTLRGEQHYWRITDITPESLDGRTAVKGLWETLMHAADKIGRIFTHPVCDLTGGYDSRALVAAFLQAGVHFSTTVSGLPESPDVVLSQTLAKMIERPNVHLESPEQTKFDQVKNAFLLTDGEYDLVEYSRIFKIHRVLSRKFHISINGSFGEVARGYWWELLFPHAGACRKLNSERLSRLRYAAQTYTPSIFPPETRLNLVSHLADVIERTNAGLTELPNTLQMDHAYLMMRMQRWQGRIASSTNRLWPCLSPFLFRTVLETMLQSSTRIRRRGLLIRKMLNEFQPPLAKFPLEDGYPAIPATWKNFYRFWPVPVYFGKRILSKLIRVGGGSWGATASRSGHLPARLQLWSEEEVNDLLRPETMKLTPLVDPTALGDFLRHSREDNFLSNDQWSRVLSLEYALSILERAKVRPLA